MSAEERLATVQAALSERGVKDVKFFFGSVSEKGVTEVADDVSTALEAINAGEFSELPSESDSIRT